MKKISNATFLRALDSSLAQVKDCEFGNSLFYSHVLLVQVNGAFFICESSEIYRTLETVVESCCYRFDSESEMLNYADKKEYFFC